MQTAHASSSLKQAHRIMTTMTMTSMHMITVTVTAIAIIITMAMIRCMIIRMEEIIVMVNLIVTWYDLMGCRSSKCCKTGLLKYHRAL